jgi:hypothetical protein
MAVRRSLARVARRALLVCTVATGALAAAAPAAGAHTLSGPNPTNYRTRVLSVTPAVPGVDVRVVDLGTRLALTNRSDTDVVVLGYEGEPYLRVGPAGVFTNVHSAATYINRSLSGGTVPPGVDTRPGLPPEWDRRSGGRTARWHDHRLHWMGDGLPPVVAAAPDRFHRVDVRTLTFEHAGTRSEVAIALDWVPAPSGARWLPVVVAFALAGFVLAFAPRSTRPLAIAVVGLVAIDVAHALAYEAARDDTLGGKLAHFTAGSFVSIAVWIAAVPTAIGCWRRRAEALYGAVFVGLLVALVGGATDLSALWHSQLQSAGPDALARAEIAVALGLGGGVALGAAARLLRSYARTGEPAPADGSRWISALVVGLGDKELRRIAAELDVEEVLAAALADLARRTTAARDAYERGAIVLDVVADDAAGTHTWSLAARDGEIRAQRGRTEPAAAEIALPFPTLLQLLAGTLAFDDVRTGGRVVCRGELRVIERIVPYLAEQPRNDPAPAA